MSQQPKPNLSLVANTLLGFFAILLSTIVILFIELHHLSRETNKLRWRALSCEAAHKEWPHDD